MRWAWTLVAAVWVVGCSEETTRFRSDGGGGEGNGSGGGGGQGATGGGGQGASGGAGASGGEGGGAPASYGFPDAWPDGTNCGGEDDVFVWKYAEDTFILRQSLCTSFEGPFLYLFFGDDRALLEDTGDGGIALESVVQGIVDAWLLANGKASIELVVAHSHGHGDHVAGDGQFQGQPGTTVVGTGTTAVASFFGIDWPTETVTYDLGNRVLDVIPIPGHQSAHVAFYDRRHQLLLTGDHLYPGRLYIQDFTAYKASTQRMVDFVAAGSTPLWVLGTHIEMTQAPGQDFPFGSQQHPNEHALELLPSHLTELNDAVQAMGNNPVYQEHDDFIVYPL
jgi:glyoxylase-like metal-dependent hydrolase (beta-lactamase superfamily II)